MEILHDEKVRKFYTVSGEKEASLRYEIREKGVWEFVATYVPEEMRGNGVGREILTFAAEYAVRNGLKIVPVCSYAQAFFEKHEEYWNIVVAE